MTSKFKAREWCQMMCNSYKQCLGQGIKQDEEIEFQIQMKPQSIIPENDFHLLNLIHAITEISSNLN